MRIYVLVPLRYPTKKAYGTNIAYTVKALRNIGYEVEIFADHESQKDDMENPIQPVRSFIFKVLKFFSQSRLGKFSKLTFLLSQLVFGIKSSRIIHAKDEKNIVITRSPIVASVIDNFSKSSITMLELHHLPNFVEIYLIYLA